MPINANVTNQQITASVGETQIDVSVGGGVGPTGPQGPAGPSGASNWSEIVGKPATFPPSSHQHAVGDVAGLQAALDGKQAAGSYVLTTDARLSDARQPLTHSHDASAISAGTLSADRLPLASANTRGAVRIGNGISIDGNGVISASGGVSSWNDLTDRPTEFPPASHSHTGLVSGTQTLALDGDNTMTLSTGENGSSTARFRIETPSFWMNLDAFNNDNTLLISHSGSATVFDPGVIQVTDVYLSQLVWPDDSTFTGSYDELHDLPTLGTAAAEDATAFAAATHAHAWSDITSGVPSTFAPSAHKASHATGGSDALTAADIGAAAASHTHTSAAISDFASAVVAAAPPTTNASLLTQGTLSASRLPTSGVAAGTYTSVTVDTYGRVTAGSTPSIAYSSLTGLPTLGSAAAASTSDFAAATHGHSISDVTGLQTALDGKQASGSYAAAVHTHVISDVTGLQTALNGKAAASHGHAIADVTGLQSALDGKQASGSYAAATHGHSISDVTGLQTALDGKAAASHTHTLSSLTQSGATTGQVAQWDGAQWAAATPSASVTYATTAQAQDGTSTSVAMNPARTADAVLNWFSLLPTNTYGVVSGGSYAVYGSSHGFIQVGSTAGSSVGARYQPAGGQAFMLGRANGNFMDFTRRRALAIRVQIGADVNTNPANQILRILIAPDAFSAIGALAGRGFGFEIRGATRRLWVVAHNGTTLSQADTGVDCAANSSFDFLVESNAGTVTLFRDGVSAGSTSGGPTTVAALGTENPTSLRFELTNGGTAQSTAFWLQAARVTIS